MGRSCSKFHENCTAITLEIEVKGGEQLFDSTGKPKSNTIFHFTHRSRHRKRERGCCSQGGLPLDTTVYLYFVFM